MRVRCGGVPVRLRARREPGIAGIEHAVRLHGSHGIVHLRGRYRQGHAWRFEPPTVTPLDGGRPQALGAPEEGPGDPWYRANERSIQAVVATLRDGPTSPLLFDWERALTLDAAAQASLGTR